MGKAVDFQKVRKRRQRTQTFKRVGVLVGVVALLGLVVFLNSLFIEEGLTTRIGDFVESFGGTGYPVSLPGGVIRDVKSVGNNLAVLNDTNLYLYNRKGRQVVNVQRMNDNTVLLTNSSRMLTYHVGGKSLAINSASKELHSREEEDNITGAALGDNGTYAIITAPKQYVARIVVYNRQFEEIYRWNSAENPILDAAISPRGNTLAVTTVNTAGGVIESALRVFRLGMVDEQRTSFPGELALHVEYLGEDRIALLTDQQYRILDTYGNVVGSYLLDAPVSKLERSGTTSLLLTEVRETRTHQVVVLDGNANVLGELSMENVVRDIALGSRRAYLLTDTGVSTYSYAMQQQEVQEERGITRIQLTGGRLYCFTAEEIHLLEDSVSVSRLERGEAEQEAEEAVQRPGTAEQLPEQEEEREGADPERNLTGESQEAEDAPAEEDDSQEEGPEEEPDASSEID